MDDAPTSPAAMDNPSQQDAIPQIKSNQTDTAENMTKESAAVPSPFDVVSLEMHNTNSDAF